MKAHQCVMENEIIVCRKYNDIKSKALFNVLNLMTYIRLITVSNRIWKYLKIRVINIDFYSIILY